MPTDGSCPTENFGNNLSVILNTQSPTVDLNKKHVTISFHTVCEAIASKTIVAYWLNGAYNLSDIMTKQISRTPFKSHYDLIYWRTKFHLLQQNRRNELYDKYT